MEVFAYAFGWVIIFIISATFHEAAHAWAAKRGGDPTAYLGGQVSLDPLPHIRREPWGMVILPLLSSILVGWPFGYASAPYDPVWAHNHPKKAAWMAAAGPAANLLLMVICGILIKIGIAAGVFAEPEVIDYAHVVNAGAGSVGVWAGIAVFLSMTFTLNLLLCVFNLIPLPPLDGSNVVMLFLKENTARSYRTIIANPFIAIFGFMLVWFCLSPLVDLAFPPVLNVLYWGAGYH